MSEIQTAFASDSDPGTLAALDLGSNSFHMVIAEQDENGSLQFIDRVKEMVRLNAGLDEHGHLSPESRTRALNCLNRFRQRLNGIPTAQIRAVGTNTFRAAHNAEQFLRDAEQALGHHISIISGHEEARLVYLGASFSLETSGRQRLVIDIGGGSTELIVGKGNQSITMSSLYMGCVSMSRRFFSDGLITEVSLRKARDAAMLELEPVLEQFRRHSWEETVGTSGTIRAVEKLSRALGLEQDWISPQTFETVREWLLDKGEVEKLDLLSDQRRPVFAGGFAILSAIFELFNLRRIQSASGALREGVLYDLNGRLHDRDSRDLGVAALASRFSIDRQQAARVSSTCQQLWQQVKHSWDIDEVIHGKMLGWASDLHEIGINIAYNQNHKHGGYILENADIDGFSRYQQRVLALLVRAHRQKFPIALFQALSQPMQDRALHMAVLIRLSVALNRGRADVQLPEIGLVAEHRSLRIDLDQTWCNEHPLTAMDIVSERDYLLAAGFRLTLNSEN